MQTHTHISAPPTEHASASAQSRLWQLLNRRIWLPTALYRLLPVLYIGLGIYALGAALFMTHWSWIVPYFMIIGVGCLHAGLVIAAIRWKDRSTSPTDDKEGPQ